MKNKKLSNILQRAFIGSLLIISFLNTGSVFGQLYYNAPMATCYDYTKDRYYVANYGAKEILEIDRAGNKKQLISGLTAPVNVQFGKFPMGFAVVIIDSTHWVFTDTVGKVLLDTTVVGMGAISDCVLDEKSGVLYTTDKVMGKIWAMEFQQTGSWKHVKFSELCSGIPKASSLILQANKNRLLVVQDTLNSKLLAVDLSSGSVSNLRSLNLSNVVGLAEDAQGNLYISAQAEQYIYQLNRYYSGAPKAVLREPKPGDVTINNYKDEWAYCCILCGKVYVARLHIFGPGTEERKCAGDSVLSGKNIFLKNIGTFESGNEFLMELSDEKGSFLSPYEIGKVADTIVPSMIAGVMPKGIPSGMGYRLRWRSTKPAVEGWLVMSEILPALPLKLSAAGDTIVGCEVDSLILNAGIDTGRIFYYSWFVDGDSVAAKSAFESEIKLKLSNNSKVKVVAQDLEYGCRTSDSVWMYRANNPVVDVLDTLIQVCTGSKVDLGRLAAGKSMANWGLKVRWKITPYGFDTAWFHALDSLQRKISVLASSSVHGEAKNYWGCTVGWQQKIDVVGYDSIAWKLISDSFLAVQTAKLNVKVYWYRNGVLINDTADKLKIVSAVDTLRFRACTVVGGSCRYCTEETVIVPKMNRIEYGEIHTDDIQLFPNPALERLGVKGKKIVNSDEFYVADMYGRILSPVKIIDKTRSYEAVELDVSLLKNGVYVLMGIGQDGTLQQLGRFVK